MATDATGAPTTLGIPKYNVSVDAPSGQGFNAAMDAIDTIITAKQLPTASGSNKVPVWNGTNWVAQTVPPAAVTPGSSGQVLATDGAGAVGWAGGMQKIAEVNLSAPAANIDWSSIPQTFAHLKIIATCRGDYAVDSTDFVMRFNNLGTNIYAYELFNGVGSTASAAASVGTAQMVLGRMPGSTAAANIFSSHEISIPGYTSSHRKAYHSVGGMASTSPVAEVLAGDASLTDAINEITLLSTNGYFVAGTRATLYGLS